MLTRLAPSPTGTLHLGNARTFLVNWALARQHGWRVLLRMEDLDSTRVRPGANEQAAEVLRWLGLDWDEGPINQSADLSPYRSALERLIADGKAYPCRCTRSQILAASLSAPHAGQGELRYPGTCRPSTSDSHSRKPLANSLNTPGVAWRFIALDEPVPFVDAFAGPQAFNPQQEVGDFLVATKDCQPSYQLAVVVDDARQGVTHVVRGDDLLNCTARQIQLYHALDLGPIPKYTHVPLVVGEDDRRLAKRHGDTHVSHYRGLGVRPERVIGLMAEWCGLGERRELSPEAFAEAFELDRLPHEQVMFGSAEDHWLKSG